MIMVANINVDEGGVEIKPIGQYGHLAQASAAFYAVRKADFNQATLVTDVEFNDKFH